MEEVAYRTVSLQVAIALAAGSLAYWGGGIESGKSAFYGGMIGTINGLALLRRVKAAEQAASSAPSRALGILVSGAINRFILVLLLFGMGFGVLHLNAVPALVVFAISQLAYGWGLRQSYKDLL
jgi:F0F1-type ATP synthase assembly protein I